MKEQQEVSHKYAGRFCLAILIPAIILDWQQMVLFVATTNKQTNKDSHKLSPASLEAWYFYLFFLGNNKCLVIAVV